MGYSIVLAIIRLVCALLPSLPIPSLIMIYYHLVCLSLWCPCLAFPKIRKRYEYLERNGTADPTDGGPTCSLSPSEESVDSSRRYVTESHQVGERHLESLVRTNSWLNPLLLDQSIEAGDSDFIRLLVQLSIVLPIPQPLHHLPILQPPHSLVSLSPSMQWRLILRFYSLKCL